MAAVPDKRINPTRFARGSSAVRWAHPRCVAEIVKVRVPVALLAVALAALAGCSTAGTGPSAPPSPGPSLSEAAQLAAQHGLRTQGRLQSLVDVVPDNLMASARWDYIQLACTDSGFDLGPWRGEQVTFTSYALAERLHGSPATFWTIERDGGIVGAYVTVEDATPGIFGLKQAEAQL
jgi:hypothetical protein